jgi:DNA sulfur modification protein DndB
VLQALGKVGSELVQQDGEKWKRALKPLRSIDWSRSNTAQWEGRALVGGRVSKAGHHVTLTTNLLKKHLALPLSPEEQRVEDNFARGEYDQ